MENNKIHSLKFTIPCKSEAVLNTIQKIILEVEKRNPNNPDLSFRMEVAEREMLANAFKHGCCENEKGEIKIELVFYSDRVKLRVKDSGEGFEYKNINLNSLPIFKETGRGLFMINKVADKIEFNEKGNAISAYFIAVNNN